MATFLYKWLAIPFLSLGIILSNGDPPVKTVHPIHISTLEIEHNAADKSLEITCKIFWDDFESILTRKNNNVRVDLTSEKKLADNNKIVFAYLNSHLSITIDGKTVPLDFIGFEKEDVVIYSYLEVTGISSLKKISVVNSLMHDMFEDQTEIIHVVVNGNRKSTKLDYPAKNAEFSF